MIWLFIIVITATLIMTPVFLILKYNKNTKAVYVKGTLTLILLAAAIYVGLSGMWVKQELYPYLICAGLFLGFLGDVGLEVKFVYGIAAFLAGHLFYIAAFLYLGGFTWFSIVVFMVFFAIMFGVFKILKPEFGKMLVPVTAYTLIIGAMLAVSVVMPFSAGKLSFTQINLIVIGSILFVIADFLLAIYTFLKNKYPIRVVNIHIYYFAQILLAASLYAW